MQHGDASLAIDLLGNIIKRLKDAEPVGRIVVTFDLNQLAKNDDLDLILLDQDQIIIPKKSSTVSVTGQVLPLLLSIQKIYLFMIT